MPQQEPSHPACLQALADRLGSLSPEQREALLAEHSRIRCLRGGVSGWRVCDIPLMESREEAQLVLPIAACQDQPAHAAPAFAAA